MPPILAGFDVGGTNARVHLFDRHLTPLGGASCRIRHEPSPPKVAGALAELLQRTLADQDQSPGDLEALGIGLAAQLDQTGQIVKNAPNLQWRDVDFIDHLRQALADLDPPLNPPITLVNDLTAQLYGEYIAGAVQEIDDVLAIYVGTGVGGAILSDGRLIAGANHNAGEIGHSKVVVGGRRCGCGEQGCVEAYAGGLHLERRLRPLLANHADTADDSDSSRPLLARADDLSTTDDDIAEIWQEATDYLAIVAANACTLLNPAALLIGGGVLANCHRFRSLFIAKTLPLILSVTADQLTVEEAALPDLGGMLGAAALASY